MTVRLQNLSNQNFYNVRSVVPPVSEQEEIVSLVACESSRIDNVIISSMREIALLQVYRTRLIADVVTGKLDVREAAARLPDEGDADGEIGDDLLEGDETGDDAELDADAEEIEG